MNQIKLTTGLFRKQLVKIHFLVILFYTVVLLNANKSVAQPYIDIANLKYSISPDAGLFNQNKNNNKLQFFGAGLNIPILFKNKKDALIFSPFYENWSSITENNKQRYFYSVGIPVSLSKSLPGGRWNILATWIFRMNDSSLQKKSELQIGGALIAAFKRTEKLTWKLGVYINKEYFGIFVMPLLGINWEIGKKDYLSGVLPGSLTYEHKINSTFYYGANFRALTNSYKKTQGYWRIDENQLGLYLDTYLAKNLVFNLEAGHSIYRKIRTGIKGFEKNDEKVNDNFYFKISFAYRVRFKNKN